MLKKLMGTGIVVGIAGIALPALGDWPTSRHDPARTAYAKGAAAITKPTRYWQAYMGGALGSASHVALDIDKDGTVDLVYLAGGKAIAKHADNLVVWESTPLDFNRIEGVVDLDGDGALELVVSTGRRVYVLAGSSGKVLWSNPDGEVGAIGAVRLGDVDGDTRPEIIIDDCACCGTTPTISPPGGVYHFAAGQLGAPTFLYAPLTRSHCGSSAVTVGDFDGDGKRDVAYLDAGTAIFTTGSTGATLGTSDALGENLYYASCTVANVDGRPGDELICFQNHYQASGDSGGRRLFALTFDATASPTVQVLYNLAPVPKATGQLTWRGNSLVDLDGDGQLEIVASWNDGSAWSTQIHDAGTGATLATIPEPLEGIVDVDLDKHPEVLTRNSAGLAARAFHRGGNPVLAAPAIFPTAFSLPSQHDFTQAAAGGVVGQPLAIDLDGDGKVLPVFASSQPPSYVAMRPMGLGFSPAATYMVPDGIAILTNQVYSNLNRPYPQLVLARNDGYLTFLDASFAPTNGGTFGSPEFPEVLPGMRVGGFIAAPIAPRLVPGADAVVATDSRGALVDLDASSAWMSASPAKSWELANAVNPSTAPSIASGQPGLVCNSGGALVALAHDGTKLWTQPMPGGGSVTYDPLAGDVNGDGISDVFTAYTTGGSVLNLQAWNGKDGKAIWPAPYTEAMQWGFQPFALADHDGNGTPDMVVVSNTLRVLDGASGSTLAQNPTFYAYFTPVIADVDGDGVPDVTMSRGYFPARTFQHDLSTTLWVGDDDRPYQHGARAACPGGTSVWIQPSTQVQGMVRLVAMNGATAGTATTLYLASGKAYQAPADATAAGAFLGALGDVVVKEDLLGTADHPSALIGSSDGFLYALNPCVGAVDWTFDLKFAVGNPIFADPAGAGVDQILVPAADGYIHALQQQVLEAPAHVYDNPTKGSTVVPGPDVDTVKTVNALGGSWAPVAGADGYQVAVLTEGGTFVTQPDWVSVGNVTAAAVANLSIAAGKKYFFAVRAVSKTKGSSVDTVSNGAVVETPMGLGDGGFIDDEDAGTGVDAGGNPPPDGGAPNPNGGGESDSGCGCRAAGGEATPLGAWAAAALLALGMRRRSARRA